MVSFPVFHMADPCIFHLHSYCPISKIYKLWKDFLDGWHSLQMMDWLFIRSFLTFHTRVVMIKKVDQFQGCLLHESWMKMYEGMWPKSPLSFTVGTLWWIQKRGHDEKLESNKLSFYEKARISCTGLTDTLYLSKKALSRMTVVKHRTLATDMNTMLMTLNMRWWLLIWKDRIAPLMCKITSTWCQNQCWSNNVKMWSELNPSTISPWTYTSWRTLHTICQTSRLQTFVVAFCSIVVNFVVYVCLL